MRQHPDEVEVFFAGKLIERMPRVRDGGHRIDYRHIIWSLVRKPGAFPRYRFREDLFPSLVFRRAYDALPSQPGRFAADVEYVRILRLTASTMALTVERRLSELVDRGQPFDYADVKATTSPDREAVPEVAIGAPDLGAYETLLGGATVVVGGVA